MEVSGSTPEAVLLFPWAQAKAEKLPGHFPPCLVHSSDIDLMVVVDSCHLFIYSKDGAFIEIKCPTAGNQFFSMMMSCLSKQSWIIAKDQSGNPVRLYKNCATFRATELNCVVTISFISPYIEVYVKSDNERKPANYHLIASIILQCLEKIKLINGHIFDSNIRFYCNCRKTSEKHTCSFHKESGYTSMECERNSIFSPDSSQLKWLGRFIILSHTMHTMSTNIEN